MRHHETLETRCEDATALFAEAAVLMRRAHGLRQELEAAPASGVEETERLVHGATMTGIETGLQQGFQAARRALREARDATGEAPRSGCGHCSVQRRYPPAILPREDALPRTGGRGDERSW